MRLAVFSDIHGNNLAFQSVLRDLEAAGGADKIWILGDLVVAGHDPAGVMATIRDMQNVEIIRGNTDRELITGAQARMPKLTEENWQQFAAWLQVRHENYLWTLKQLGWNELEYLLKLHTEIGMEVESYGFVMATHAVPGDDEFILLPDVPESAIRDAFSDREARLAFAGHTHRQMDRQTGTLRLVNPGSIGMPLDGDQRAAYALVTFENGEAQVDLRRVPYDVDRVMHMLEQMQHPAAEWINVRLRNARPPG